MNFRDLQYFLAVSRLNHFGKAAMSCHVSQPALSNQIKKLENELGVVLFERSNKSVRLTDAGKALVPLAESALSLYDTIKTTADSVTHPFSGTVRLGGIPTIAPYVMPKLFQLGRQALPQLTIEFEEEITDRLTERLNEGTIDAALIATPIEDAKLASIALYDEPFWVVFPCDHPLENQRLIKASDLPTTELLMLNEGHCFRDQAADICRIDATNPRRSIRANSLEMLLKMVAVGQGITLVPETAIDNEQLSLAVKRERLCDENAYRRVYLAYRRTYPRTKILYKIAELICAELPSALPTLYKAEHKSE